MAFPSQRRFRWLPALATGTIRPVIDGTYPLADAARAHRRMESGANVGKILLRPEQGRG